MAQLNNAEALSFVFGGNDVRPIASGGAGFEELDAGTRWPQFGRNGSGIPDRVRDSDGRPLSGPIAPLRRDGDSWRLSPDDTGVIVFQRGLRTWQRRPPMPEVISIGLQAADRRGQPHDGAYLFDPGSQTLYRIMPTSFHLARPDAVFSSQQCEWGCSDWIALLRKMAR